MIRSISVLQGKATERCQDGSQEAEEQAKAASQGEAEASRGLPKGRHAGSRRGDAKVAVLITRSLLTRTYLVYPTVQCQSFTSNSSPIEARIWPSGALPPLGDGRHLGSAHRSDVPA